MTLLPSPEQIHRSTSMKMSVVVQKTLLDEFPSVDTVEGELASARYIDVWWILHDGNLLSILAFLLNRHKVSRAREMHERGLL